VAQWVASEVHLILEGSLRVLPRQVRIPGTRARGCIAYVTLGGLVSWCMKTGLGVWGNSASPPLAEKKRPSVLQGIKCSSKLRLSSTFSSCITIGVSVFGFIQTGEFG
jgi:hypothetical protein